MLLTGRLLPEGPVDAGSEPPVSAPVRVTEPAFMLTLGAALWKPNAAAPAGAIALPAGS